MALKLPFFQDAAFNYNINLGDKTYNLSYSWVDRTENWYLTIRDTSGNIIQSRIKLHPNLYLVRPSIPFVEDSNLYLLRETNNTATEVARDNIGQGKDFNMYLATLGELNVN